MKSSYTDSLITVAAAVAQACSLQINKQVNPDAPITCKGLTLLKLNTINKTDDSIVGIKFDNTSAIKYFILIHSIQQKTQVNNIMEKSDDLVLTGSLVTAENELIRVYGRNEPSVLCQSTFL